MAKKKVKLKKRIRVLGCLVFIAILGVLVFFYFRNTWMSEKKNDLEKEDLKKEEKKPQEYSAKIFIGVFIMMLSKVMDLMISSRC